MALVGIQNETRGTLLAEGARWADRFWSRLRGLLGRKELPPGEGMVVVLVPYWSVHTFFLRFPIDVVHVDRQSTVVKTVSALKPFRVCAGGRSAHYALEVPTGTIRKSATSVGDQLRFEEV